jgi:hypothetical protein
MAPSENKAGLYLRWFSRSPRVGKNTGMNQTAVMLYIYNILPDKSIIFLHFHPGLHLPNV